MRKGCPTSLQGSAPGQAPQLTHSADSRRVPVVPSANCAPYCTILQQDNAMPRTPHILTIQSHVVFGHAGNSAAEFPMRRVGVNVWPLNTVQFSNHTQYGHWTGEVLPPEQIPSLVDGIAAIGEL